MTKKKTSYKNYIATDKDGFYPTPKHLVELTHKVYLKYFGEEQDLIIWDASCGHGALTNGMEFNHKVYSSSLYEEDLEKVENPNKFQFDFLHDDVSKLPQDLQEALKEGKVLYYQNPPYNKMNTKYGQSLAGQGLGTNTSMLRQLFQLRALELGINKFINIVPEQTFLSRAAQQVVDKMPPLNFCTGFPGSVFPGVNIPAICIFVHGAEAPVASEYVVRDEDLKPVMVRGFQDYSTPAYKDVLRKDVPRNTHKLPRFTSPYKLSTSTSGPQGSGLPKDFPYTSEGVKGVPKKEGYGHFAPTTEDFGVSVSVPKDFNYSLATGNNDFCSTNSVLVEPFNPKISHPEALIPEDYAYYLGTKNNDMVSENFVSVEPVSTITAHPETLVPEDYAYWQFGGKNGIDVPASLLTEPAGGVSGSQSYPETFTGVRDKLTYFALREVGKNLLPKTLHRTEPMTPDFTNPKYIELRELGFLYAMFAKQNYMVGGTIIENKLSLFNEWSLKKDEPVYIKGMELMNKYKDQVPVDAGFWNVWNWFMTPKEKAEFNKVRDELAKRIFSLGCELKIYIEYKILEEGE